MAGYMQTAKKTCWETPPDLFARLNRIWHFDLDAASTHQNALCKDHYTEDENGLSQSWANRRVWLNPPYGRDIEKWAEKAQAEARQNGAIVVALLPARTDTKWFHKYVAGGVVRNSHS